MKAHTLVCVGALVAALGTGRGRAASVDTAITYQGQLQQSGSPAQGAFDLRFTLYDSLESGTQVGATLAADAVPINHGLFTVNLDFGADVFNGEARWLEIEVRASESGEAFTRLAPRQPLTPVPYAIQASSAGQVAAEHITGTLTDAQLPSNLARLNADAIFAGRVVATGFAGDGALLTGISSLDGFNGGAPDALQVNPNGLVGIGTPTPQAGLHLAAAKSSFQTPRRLAELVYGPSGTPLNRSVFLADNMAYVLSAQGLSQIDVSNPAQPRLARSIRLPESDPYDNWFTAARSLFAAGDNAYVTCGAYENFGGTTHPSALVVVNLAVTNKTIAHRLFDGQDGCDHLDGAASVFVSGTTAYITAQADSALTILDVSDPASPQLLAEVVNGQGGFNHLHGARAVFVSGATAYIAAHGATDGKTQIPGALTILDISNPRQPQLLAEVVDGQGGFNHLTGARSIHVSGTTAYVASCLFDPKTEAPGALTILDVSDPRQPRFLAEVVDGQGGFAQLAGACSVDVAGATAYVAAFYDHALTILDVSDPAHPRWLAESRNAAGEASDWLGGATSVFASGPMVLATDDLQSVLCILDATPRQTGLTVNHWVGIGTTAPQSALDVAGTVTAAAFHGDGSGLANVARLNGPNAFTGNQTIANGRFGLDTANPNALLSLGNTLADTKLALWDSGDPSRLFGLGVQGYQFRLHLASPASRFSFLDAPAGNELLTIQGTGKVGIGTIAPMARLHIESGTLNEPAILLSSESTGWGSGLQLENRAAATTWGMYTYAVDGSLCIGHDKFIGTVLRVFTNGTTAVTALDVAGSVTAAGTVTSSRFHGDGSGLANVAKLAGPNAFTGNQTFTAGNVGIGTTSPVAKLHIESGTANEPALILSSSSIGWGSGLMLKNTSGGTVRTWGMYTYEDGTFCLGSVEQSQHHLTVKTDGTTCVRVLEINGGMDIAEPFTVSAQSEILPGHVVCIDPQQPGALCLSTRAYDPTVAGIVSGANGIKAGMILRQEDTVADGTHPVALTGRVWCYCDADAGGPIQPGDLLTTADTPGHAMKAVDRQRAYGAVLGKAMTALSQGRGHVLVLVGLQ